MGEAEKEMQMKALKFLDKSMQTDYENLLKYDKKWQNAWPSPEQVEFLFVRSSYRDILNWETPGSDPFLYEPSGEALESIFLNQ